jgi:hypothetical protein
MSVLPEPPAATAGQAANPLTDAVIQAAIENALHEARRTDTAPPAGRERPAMSGQAVDSSVRMIAFGGMTLMVSAGGGILMVASDFADPTVIGMICAAPAALALPVLAVARLIRRAGETSTEHHHHYNGPVRQETSVDQRKAVWQKDVMKPRR